jgi:hypothetical protein
MPPLIALPEDVGERLLYALGSTAARAFLAVLDLSADDRTDLLAHLWLGDDDTEIADILIAVERDPDAPASIHVRQRLHVALGG